MTTAASTAPSAGGALGQPRGIGFAIVIFFLIIPAIVWFVKVQGALNGYWRSKAGAASATAPVTA